MSEPACEAIDQLVGVVASKVIQRVAEGLVPELLKHMAEKTPDALMSASEAGKYLGVSYSTIRRLVDLGHLKPAPGISEIKIRRSVLDAYGKHEPGKAK